MHYAYLLRGQSSGLVKIGITKNPANRFKSYKTGIPERISHEALKLFPSEEEAKCWESWVHRRNKESVVHGEWMGLTFQQVAEIWADGEDASSLMDANMVYSRASPLFGGGDEINRVLCCDSHTTACRLIDLVDRSLAVKQQILLAIPRLITTAVLEEFDWKRQTRGVVPATTHSTLAVNEKHHMEQK